MNDPHVVALIYDIEHDSTIDYSRAPSLTKELDKFTVKICGEQVRLEPKDHYASVEEALIPATDFVGNWELDVVLQTQPGQFSLVFNRPEIIDRNPTQGIARISAHFRTGIPSVRATLRVATSAYPEPPSQLTLDHDDNNVVLLLNRYSNYRKGREPLASMAYFCSTMLSERLPTGETRAKKLNVSRKLHTKIRKLSSRQGGPMGARKWDATAVDLNASEVTFLEQAVKLIIRRVAEVARDETQQLPPITLANLPKIRAAE